MKYLNVVLTLIIAVLLFKIFWPLLLVFVVFIMVYILYIRIQFKKAIKRQGGFEQSFYDNQSTDESSYSSDSDVIDVEYSERDVNE